MGKPREVRRACAVCSKRLRVKVYEDGHYKGGYYCRLEIPIGKGEYRRVGSSTLLKEKIDVVTWTGKKKKAEYWECEPCFEKASHETWLEDMIERLFGERCKDYEASCPSCSAWAVYDTILDEAAGRL